MDNSNTDGVISKRDNVDNKITEAESLGQKVRFIHIIEILLKFLRVHHYHYLTLLPVTRHTLGAQRAQNMSYQTNMWVFSILFIIRILDFDSIYINKHFQSKSESSISIIHSSAQNSNSQDISNLMEVTAINGN